MTTPPRRFPLAVVVLVACVGAASGCRRETPVTAARWIPSDASTVIRIDLARMRGTLMEQRVLAWLADNDYFRWKADDLVKQTGLDVRKDLDGVILASADSPGDGKRGEFGAIFLGRFDAGRLRTWYDAQVRKNGGTPRTSSHAGHTIHADGDEATNVVVVNKRVAIIASKGWIRRMLDLVGGTGKDVRARPELAPLLGRLPADRIVGIAMHVGEAQRREAAARNLPFLSLTGAIVTIDSAQGLEVNARLENTTPEGARTLAAKIADAIKQTRNNATVGKAGLAATLDLISTRVEGQASVTQVTLTKAQFDDTVGAVRKLLAGAAGLGGGMGGIGGGLNLPGVFGGDPRGRERNLGGPAGKKPPAPASQP